MPLAAARAIFRPATAPASPARAKISHIGDKPGYSALASAGIRAAALGARDVILTGVETDVCVLATAIEAMEAGLRVILAADALTSSSLSCHAKALDILHDRFEEQIEVATVDQILAAWQ